MANVVKKHSISSELAQKMVDAAVAKARELGVSENVAILDDGGNLKAFSRMDGASMPTIEIAQKKAYTALFGVSTQDFFNFIQGDPSLLAGIPTLARVSAWPGAPPDTFDTVADPAADFIGALGLAQIDLLGFSIGGYIAQPLALRRPELIRRLILAGTGPRAGEPPQDPKYGEYAALTDAESGKVPIEAFLYLFFRPSETSQAAARAFWARRHMRKEDVDPPTSAQTMAAQRAAITEWRQPRGERFAELKAIKQPTLVVNGHNDIMVPTINSFTLSQNIPNAQLIIYPDAGHGALFQVPELFVAHAEMFLDA